MNIARTRRRLVGEARRYAGAADRRAIRRALAREAFFRAAGRFTPTLEAQWPSGRYVVSTADRDVSRHAFAEGPYDLAMLHFAAQLIEQHGDGIAGREVLEIGANIGTTTIPLLTTIGVSHVHAFEPEPWNYRLLRQNILVNDVTGQVSACQAAVSDHDGALLFVATPRNGGSGHVARDFEDATHEVPCVTVDMLLRQEVVSLDRLGLVWIDVEGHEASVLAGAETLSGVPIVIEYQPRLHSDLRRLHELIARHSSRLFDLGSGLEVSVDVLQCNGATDLLLMP